MGLPAQRAEADGGADAIAQEDEAGRDFAFEERLQRLGEKGGSCGFRCNIEAVCCVDGLKKVGWEALSVARRSVEPQ